MLEQIALYTGFISAALLAAGLPAMITPFNPSIRRFGRLISGVGGAGTLFVGLFYSWFAAGLIVVGSIVVILGSLFFNSGGGF